MSQDDSIERQPETRREARDSWYERFKIALGLKPVASIRDDLEEALDESEQDETGEFSREERRILRNLLTARDIRVQDVMVPRGSVVGVSEKASLADLRALFASAGHSRLPVYGETLDDAKGMIHIRDMFARLGELPQGAQVGDTGLLRPVLFAPGTMPALDLLLEMQGKRIHMALVVDEYGATDGLVSLEDLIEIIVGEIEDEHDIVADPELEQLADGSFAINAQASIESVSQLVGFEIAPAREEHEVDTIGGYITALLGRVPAKGEVFDAPGGLTFSIIEADSRRIRRIGVAQKTEGASS
ncbi:MAG: hemolysin family protein [Proteobacteria bacterium]|nr:hemolysin family protein [Pseudomonadota bacterium]